LLRDQIIHLNLVEILNKLYSNSNTPADLSIHISDNIHHIYDELITANYTLLISHRSEIEEFLYSKYHVIKNIDLANSDNFTFLTLLLDICERFNLTTLFQRFYKLVQRASFKTHLRLEASAIYIIGINSLPEQITAADAFFNKLNEAYTFEEDGADRILAIVTNFYAQAVLNYGQFNQPGLQKLKETINSNRQIFTFIDCDLLDKVLLVNTVEYLSAFKEIHSILDAYLHRVNVIPISNTNLIESGTDYCNFLNLCTMDIYAIRQIAVGQYRLVGGQAVFNSLGKGVEVLHEEKQLYQYLYSYGKMHFAKIQAALQHLPTQCTEKPMDLIDWGCGQALATISVLHFANTKITAENITLVEPSEIALKRGSLHVKKFSASASVLTINKTIDMLLPSDFNPPTKNIYLHLFSNILDVENFSITKLIALIKSSFRGINYFIVVSPCMSSQTRRNRLSHFVNSFASRDGFSLYKSVIKQKGEWKNEWTMILYVFKVEL
jgi:hypothetical protein